jgi:hypothetical protein
MRDTLSFSTHVLRKARPIVQMAVALQKENDQIANRDRDRNPQAFDRAIETRDRMREQLNDSLQHLGHAISITHPELAGHRQKDETEQQFHIRLAAATVLYVSTEPRLIEAKPLLSEITMGLDLGGLET